MENLTKTGEAGSSHLQGAAGPAPSRSARRHALNIAVLVIAIVALFWKVFFLGYTLLDVSTLNNQLPWGYSSGQYSDYPYDRRDPTDMYVTREYFAVHAYRDGELPLWNQYTMSGLPMYADGVTKIFSPSLLFYTFLDVPVGYSVGRIAELLLAAIFLYIFLIGIGIGLNGALFGSLVFSLSSHAMLHVTGLGWWGGLMWLPLILLFASRAIKRRSYTQALLAGLFFAAQFFCGFLANQIYYLGAIILYYIFFGWINSRRGRQHEANLRTAVAMAGVTILAGFVLSATQWVPVFELLKYSNRLIVGTESSYIYLPPWYIATLVFPNLFGSAYDPKALTLFTGINVSHDHLLYAGVAALIPIGFCLFRMRHGGGSHFTPAAQDASIGMEIGPGAKYPGDSPVRENIRFFLILSGIALLLMMGAPIYVHITRFLPVMRTIRVVVRAGVLFIFAVAALAGLGMELLLNDEPAFVKRFCKLATKLFLVLCSLAALAVLIAYVLKACGFQAPYNHKGKLAFIHRAAGLLSLQFTPPDSGIWLPLALLGIAVLLLALFSSSKVDRRLFYVALVIVLAGDLAWNSRYFDRPYDASRVFPHTEITDQLAALPPGRVLPTPSDIDLNRRVSPGRSKIIAPPNTLLAYRIPAITGKDQLFPRWYQEYARLIEAQPNMSHVVFDRSSSPFFNLLNVKYILTHQSSPPPINGRLLLSAEGLSLYENESVMPRAFISRRAVAVPDAKAAAQRLRDGNFDPSQSVVIESERPLAVIGGGGAEPGTATSTATITETRLNSVEVATDSNSGGILVLSDTYYPGWRASIDGTPAKIYKADLTMRAVEVPAGRHTVAFRFSPRSLVYSLYVSLLGAVAAVGYFLAALWLRRKTAS
ncbi:MAG TPA: YfhO family protein [Blastocatellia bacterium]|nr:YfhO family protein [Blastocatellia bacterium]